jgi:hypothetical protein
MVYIQLNSQKKWLFFLVIRWIVYLMNYLPIANSSSANLYWIKTIWSSYVIEKKNMFIWMSTGLGHYFGRLVIFHGHINCEEIIVITNSSRETRMQHNNQNNNYIQDQHCCARKRCHHAYIHYGVEFTSEIGRTERKTRRAREKAKIYEEKQSKKWPC